MTIAVTDGFVLNELMNVGNPIASNPISAMSAIKLKNLVVIVVNMF